MTRTRIVTDLASHAIDRVNKVFEDGLALLDTTEECELFVLLLTEYVLRSSSLTLTEYMPGCRKLSQHERMMVIGSLLSKMAAVALDEPAAPLTVEQAQKLGKAVAELTQRLEKIGLVYPRTQEHKHG